MESYAFLEEALRPERLTTLAGEVTKGTGGPAIPLPDGSSVTTDVIIKALETAPASAGCAALVEALRDRRLYIRYGALLLLQQLTGVTDSDYYPFQDPDLADNAAAIAKWRARCESFHES